MKVTVGQLGAGEQSEASMVMSVQGSASRQNVPRQSSTQPRQPRNSTHRESGLPAISQPSSTALAQQLSIRPQSTPAEYPAKLPREAHTPASNHPDAGFDRAVTCNAMISNLLKRYSITELADVLHATQESAFAFSLEVPPVTRSRLGGEPLLPEEFDWPTYFAKPVFPKGEPETLKKLDFLVQIDLSELPECPGLAASLPRSGLLTFFYDLENQPWGFDPRRAGGSRVILFPDVDLRRTPPSNPEYVLPPAGILFRLAETLPSVGSRSFEKLESTCELPESYFDFASEFERSFYPPNSGLHRLFGHSANVQGDMQLEAQLVSNGLYCGDPSGYEDPRRAALEAGAEDWMLLLQLDSDERCNLMWGDLGMLYFWIRREDLAKQRFDRTWMTLQCG